MHLLAYFSSNTTGTEAQTRPEKKVTQLLRPHWERLSYPASALSYTVHLLGTELHVFTGVWALNTLTKSL